MTAGALHIHALCPKSLVVAGLVTGATAPAFSFCALATSQRAAYTFVPFSEARRSRRTGSVFNAIARSMLSTKGAGL